MILLFLDFLTAAIFSVIGAFCFQKFCHCALILNCHLEDISSSRALPWQQAKQYQFHQEYFKIKQNADQIQGNNLHVSVFYVAKWSTDFQVRN